MSLNLIVATGNPGKLVEMQAYLADLGCQLSLKPPEIEIEETGTTFAENAALKATQTAQALKQWAIADDSGLAVTALDGAPGLYSARYGKTDTERIQRLLTAMQGQTQRQAEFICALAVADPQGKIRLQALGTIAGEILEAPHGEHGFGYDPIFYVPSLQKSFAEMTPAEKHEHSHRGVAFRDLKAQWQTVD